MDELASLMKRLEQLGATTADRELVASRLADAGATFARVQNNHGVIAGSISGPIAIGTNSQAYTGAASGPSSSAQLPPPVPAVAEKKEALWKDIAKATSGAASAGTAVHKILELVAGFVP
jgi:hypothetical protein